MLCSVGHRDRDPVFVFFRHLAPVGYQSSHHVQVNRFIMTLIRALAVLWTCIFIIPTVVASSHYVPNYLYSPKHIPHNYLEMVAGKAETLLHKIDSETAHCGRSRIDIREITILDLQQHFKSKRLTSTELVRCYLTRIKLMNPYLNAVLEINPDAIRIAGHLDREREQDAHHGPLYGIPVLLKDTMGTGDGMENTAGAVALLSLKPKNDSEVVRKLRKAGAVILGKANLSEFGK